MRNCYALALDAGSNRQCLSAAGTRLLFASAFAALLLAALGAPSFASEGTAIATPGDLIESPQAQPLTIVEPATSDELTAALLAASIDLGAVRAGTVSVPRIYVTNYPADLKQVRGTSDGKQAFLGALLPLVLMSNEEILAERAELERLVAKEAAGEALSIGEQAWMAALAEQYEVAPGDNVELLKRVDVLPVALTLAQAIVESGWGTSRYAREGNALFGQRTWHPNAPGLTARKDGKTLEHRARAFADLMQSVRSYMRNLNTHNAYSGLRDERARLRSAGEVVEGTHLAGFLGSYAESPAYIDMLRRIMRHNELAAYEIAVLDATPLGAGPSNESEVADTAAEVVLEHETLAETLGATGEGVQDEAGNADISVPTGPLK